MLANNIFLDDGCFTIYLRPEKLYNYLFVSCTLYIVVLVCFYTMSLLLFLVRRFFGALEREAMGQAKIS